MSAAPGDTLRPYQVEAMDAVREEFRRGIRRVILQSPTGAGKTTIASAMVVEAVARGRRVCFLAHRQELIYQAHARLAQHGIQAGIIMGDATRNPSLPVQVASIQTLTRRKQRLPYDLIVVDECHRTLGKSYLGWLANYPSAYVVGLSATPYRTDGRGLSEFYGALVLGPSPGDLMDQGYLVPCSIFSPPTTSMAGSRVKAGDFAADEMEQRCNTPKLVGNLVTHWRQHAAGRPTVAFAVSVAHSLHIADEFKRSGYRAAHLDGETHPQERAQMLRDLAGGALDIVTNCAVLTEGWDSPAVSCAIVARPTLSRGLWRQMAGRVLRTHPGKRDAIILDHGGCARLHGHVLDPDPCTLSGGVEPVRPSERTATLARTCLACYAVMPARPVVVACPYCGEPLRQQRALPRAGAGTLSLVERGAGPLVRDPVPERALAQARQWADIAKSRGYKPGWLFHKLRVTFGPAYAAGLLDRLRAAS